MNDPTDGNDPSPALLDLIKHSKIAVQQQGAFIAVASDALMVSNALANQWLEMNRKFFDRSQKRLKVTVENMSDGDQPGETPMSYYERSDKLHGVATENFKDYLQQCERFSINASILMQRMFQKGNESMAELWQQAK